MRSRPFHDEARSLPTTLVGRMHVLTIRGKLHAFVGQALGRGRKYGRSQWANPCTTNVLPNNVMRSRRGSPFANPLG
jgi:hypothetical protein